MIHFIDYHLILRSVHGQDIYISRLKLNINLKVGHNIL